MTLYYYKAITMDNNTVEGQMEAESKQTVASKLQEMGYFPVSMWEADTDSNGDNKFFSKSISQDDVLLLTQKLAVTMKAGLTLDSALNLLIETAESPKLKAMLEKVTLSVHNGVSLSDAFEQHSNAFDRFYLNTLRAGEAAGTLDLVLSRLTVHLEHARTIKKKLQAALIYPTVLMSVAILTLLILLLYVVPQFQTLFAEMGQELPFSTQVVITVAEGIKLYGWIVVLLTIVFVLLIKRRLRDREKRQPIDQILLSLPFVSDILIKLEVARFSRTLATLLSNGVPVLTALNVVCASLKNTVIQQLVESVKESVQQGQGVAAVLLKQPIFPPMAVQLIRMGEETGELTPMLEQVADIYDEELSDSIQRFLTLFEPILVISLGIVIAAIIISVLLAILALNDFAF